ncbi:hypothetical protein HMJ29_18020 [Hymenobacter taeanensis]|uniref:Uncharacterized protein n=1 Tax=Hymenobacter taeanensis TaxID=2735321 RepID=A0A6M6BL47_9BACT|nr:MULTISPECIES: hypothetical protein [Hymenobacter]QJX48712.1 hypothetical protein HMJ29_18020 [Hymenobacter taeanensis]UOQ81789.1 hypothetical protein MUN83_03080 [Hymenobacter sp. 5414T-23]
MKNVLLALSLFAFVGSAAAHEGHNGDKTKKGKKEVSSTGCSMDKKMAAGGSCCMKKGAKTAAVTPSPAPVKSL